jgi:hypothetical protein
MTVSELIDELQDLDPEMEIVTCDGFGLVDPILLVSIENIGDCDNIVADNSLDSVKQCVVLGWNH